MSTGRADRQRRHLHPRPGDDAGVDGFAQRHVDELAGADIPDRGEAGFERSAGVEMRLDRGVDRAAAEQALVVVPGIAAGDVGMAVDQAGQQGGAAQVDDRGAGRDRQIRAGSHDPVAFDDDHRIAHRGAALAVYQPGRANRGSCRGLLRDLRRQQAPGTSVSSAKPNSILRMYSPATVRLKPDTTYDHGPAEAGHYVRRSTVRLKPDTTYESCRR